jgi:hypothetical protein
MLKLHLLLFILLISFVNIFGQDSFVLNYECNADVLSNNGELTYGIATPVKMKVLFNEGTQRNIITVQGKEEKIHVRTKDDIEKETPKGTRYKLIFTELKGELVVFQLLENLNLRIMTSDVTYFIEYSCVADFNIGVD